MVMQLHLQQLLRAGACQTMEFDMTDTKISHAEAATTQELITQYVKAPVDEAAGFLHALADRVDFKTQREEFDSEAFDFILHMASEYNVVEFEKPLRRAAQSIIVHKFMPRPLRKDHDGLPPYYWNLHGAIRIIRYLAESDAPAPKKGQGQKITHDFLRRVGSTAWSRDKPHNRNAYIKACIRSGYVDGLDDSDEEAFNDLYEFLEKDAPLTEVVDNYVMNSKELPEPEVFVLLTAHAARESYPELSVKLLQMLAAQTTAKINHAAV